MATQNETLTQLKARLLEGHPTLLTQAQISGKWFTLAEAGKESTCFEIPSDADYGVDMNGKKALSAESLEDPIHQAVANALLYAQFYLGISHNGLPTNMAPPLLHCCATWAKTPAGEPLFYKPKAWPIKFTPLPDEAEKTIQTFRALVHTVVGKLDQDRKDQFADTIAADIGIAPQSDEEGHFREFWAVNWEGGYRKSISQMMMYFLRLFVRSAADLNALYIQTSHYNGIFNYSRVPKKRCFRHIAETYLGGLANELDYYKPTIGNYLSIVRCQKTEADYEVLKKYFALRLEYHGMANLIFCARIKKHTDLISALARVADRKTVFDLKRLVFSILLYIDRDETIFADATATVSSPAAMSKDDLISGQYGRLFSTKFMPWLTYARTDFISQKLAGLTLGVEGLPPEHNPYLSNAAAEVYQFSYSQGQKLMVKEFEEDPHILQEVKDDFKKGKEAYKQYVPQDIQYEDYSNEALRKLGYSAAQMNARTKGYHLPGIDTAPVTVKQVVNASVPPKTRKPPLTDDSDDGSDKFEF